MRTVNMLEFAAKMVWHCQCLGYLWKRSRIMRETRTTQGSAFTVVDLLIVITVLLCVMAVILPGLAKARVRKGISCNSNLRQVGLAFKTWAIDNTDKFPMQVSVTNGGTMELVKEGNVWPHFMVMSNELSTPKILFCPEESDGRRKMANGFAPRSASELAGARFAAAGFADLPLTNDLRISYFVGVEARDSSPSMLLSGDINLQIDGHPVQHGLRSVWTNSTLVWLKPKHDGHGNVLLADGSVSQIDSKMWPTILAGTGVKTNVLAFP
jgi:prepilin-type processing-associated H-X9-DG protein